MNAHDNTHSSRKANVPRTGNEHPDPASGAIQRPAVPALLKVAEAPVQQEGNTKAPLTGETVTVQKKNGAPVQLKSKNGSSTAGMFKPVQPENKTGLPDGLKSGVEKLSGTSLSDVKVHFNSSQPTQYKALAYAQGTDIHIAPGQEQHLAHEAWHVAQQKQGRVQATTQMKGAGINDDVTLEKEADDMGAKAMQADSLSSGYEAFGKSDIGDIKEQSLAPGKSRPQTLQQVNSEINVSIQRINSSDDTSVQQDTVTQLVSGKFLVDDGGTLGEGQMHKSDFLSLLRTEVKKAAKEILAPVGLAQDNCPDLNYWIGYYQEKDITYFESAIAKYAPATASAASAGEYLVKLAGKVKDALTKHVATGVNEFDPEEAPAEVEDKRPPTSWLPVQRKQFKPIQFKCGSVVKDPDDTGDTNRPDMERKGPAVTAPLTGEHKGPALARGERLAEMAVDDIRAHALQLRQLFSTGQYVQIGDILFANAKARGMPMHDMEMNKITTSRQYVTKILNACSTTATAISLYITGRDLLPTAVKPGATVNLLQPEGAPGQYALSGAFTGMLTDNGDCTYSFSYELASHYFTVVSFAGSYDFYESDASPEGNGNAAIHFLPIYDPNPVASQSGAALSAADLGNSIANMFARLREGKGGRTGLEDISSQVRHIKMNT